MTFLLAPIIILTFMNLRFCLNENTQQNQIAVLVDTIVFDIFLSILMSMQWIITIMASIALKISLYKLMTGIDKVENFTLLIFPMTLCLLLQILSGYMAERYLKQNFEKINILAQNFSNMKTILDNINEAVVVSRP